MWLSRPRLLLEGILGKGALEEVLPLIGGGTIVIVGGFYGIGALRRIDRLSDATFITYAQWAFGVIFSLGMVGAVVGEILKARSAMLARRANAQVAQALEQITSADPSVSVADITPQSLAGNLLGAPVSGDHLARLVEQHKQQLLIDDEYFQRELSYLIVDYLQPLPRNAKRLVNRLRVNLLIAHARGMLVTDPKVTTQQLGKWLVLSERWPQLARALSASPETMRDIEQRARRADAFKRSLKLLAPFYAEDQDLRQFIQSKPSLADVLPRLVHYGWADTEGRP